MIRISDDIAIDEREVHFEFVRASGPGGQNVNKVATAAQLRFDLAGSSALAPEVKERLARLAGSRMTTGGVLIIQADRRRTQKANRRDALDRLIELIRRAAVEPTPRVPTRPTAGSKQRRLESKKRRARIKQLRGRTSQ